MIIIKNYKILFATIFWAWYKPTTMQSGQYSLALYLYPYPAGTETD